MSEKNQNQSATHLTLSVIFLVATLAIVFLTDPFKTVLFVILFFASLAGFCLNFFMFFLERVIYRIKASEQAAVNVDHQEKVAARQALLLTILVVGLLFLSSQQMLYWWLAAIFIITLVFIEGFFLAN